MANPAFWEDGGDTELQRERTSLEQRLAEGARLETTFDDIDAMLELAEEGEHEAITLLQKTIVDLSAVLDNRETQHLLGTTDDSRPALLEVHSGAGGTESQDWTAILLRMYTRWAESRGYAVEVLDESPGEEAGLKSATLRVEGEFAFGYMKGETGVHRLVRISPFDASSRRHTSFASVMVSPEIDDDIEVDIDEKDLRIDTYRSSGAGGQHVNVTDSAVRITHIPTGIVVSCQNERSQHRNRDSATKVLRARLYDMKLKEQQNKLEQIGGEKKEIAFGNQIRSYVLHPYRLIKDHRTKMEVGDVDSVLDGQLDGFIKAYLMQKASGTLGKLAEDE